MAKQVNIVVLKGAENWNAWKFHIKVIAKAAEVWNLMVQDLEPKEEDETKKYKKWKKKDCYAQQLITTKLTEGLLIHIMDCNKACEMWSKLTSIYEQSNEMSLQILQSQFFSYKYDESKDVVTHISNLSALVNKIKEAGESISEAMVMTRVITSLPKRFQHFISAWESVPADSQNMNNLTSRLMNEEKRMIERKNNQTNSGGNMALYAKRDYCTVCKKDNHKTINCFFRDKQNNTYNKTSHPTLDKRKQTTKNNSNNEQQRNNWSKGNNNKPHKNALIGMAMFNEDSSHSEEQWYMDSGCNSHMSSNLKYFSSLSPSTEHKVVKIGDGRLLRVEGVGGIDVFTKANGEINESVLKDVLYVPELKLNLFSLGTAMEKGYTVVSEQNKIYLKRNNKFYVEAIKDKNLFVINMKVDKNDDDFDNNKQIACFAKEILSIQEWHERLAHQNFSHIRSLLKSENIDFKDDKNAFCEFCLLGKQCRQPFKSSTTVVSELCHTISADLCGPMEISSIGGSKYFLLLKDHYSKYRTVYFLKHKSETVDKLKEFFALAQNQTNKRIKIFKSDNGTELKNTEIEKLLKSYGIRHQTIVNYCSEQAGKIERENRTVVEAARSLIKAKNLDKKLWAEAVNTAVYVLNRSSTSYIPNKTPFELWYGVKPDLSRLEIFGSEAFVHIPKQLRKKWDSKSKKGIFVGYDENKKGFKIFYPNTDTIDVARNVIFKPKKPEESKETEQSEETEQIVDFFDENLFLDSDSESVSTQGEDNELNHPAIELNPPVQEIENKNQAIHDQENETQNQAIHEPEIENQNQNQVIEYRLRNRANIREPLKFNDYYLNFAQDEENISKDNFSLKKKIQSCVPFSYKEAMNGPEKQKWEQAINEEKDSLSKNGVFEFVKKKEVKNKILSSRWIFKIKDDGSYKARLVCRGCEQRESDYEETFSPVVSVDTLRFLIAYGVTKHMIMKQFDVKTAFLYGYLEQDLYMDLPEGYEDKNGYVCKLVKSLYGLKQAPVQWNKRFVDFLKKIGLVQLISDRSVFKNKNNDLFLAIWVDDGLIISNSESKINRLLDSLKKEFEIKIIENPTIFVGFEIIQEESAVMLHQRSYIEKLLNQYNMNSCKPVKTPSVLNDGNDEGKETKFPVREAVGSLLYLANRTRPDIAYSVNVVSRNMSNPTQLDVMKIKRIFRYLQGTKNMGLKYQAKENSFVIEAFSDADYANDPLTRRSTSGYLTLFGGGPISWGTRRQSLVSLSTAESEFVAASECVKEVLFLKALCKEMTGKEVSVILNVDNQSAIKMLNNSSSFKRSKHIDTRYKFVAENLIQEKINVKYCQSQLQLADIFTKSNPSNFKENVKEIMNEL